MLDGVSLDQLRTFIAAVDEGSFSAAARRLRRAQSMVSQTVSNLEEQIGVDLFDRSHRYPLLTAAGSVLLADARSVIAGVDAMKARARGIGAGVEPELSVVVDVMFPMKAVTDAAREFRAKFPSVPLRLYVEALGGAFQPVLDGRCNLGIVGSLPITPLSLTSEALWSVSLMMVAARTHPLAAIEGVIPKSMLAKHVQLVLTDRTDLSEGRELGVLSPLTWRLGDLFAKHAFLVNGLGWGSMPHHAVERDLAESRLKMLSVTDVPAEGLPLQMSAVYRTAAPPGPAGRWFVQYLKAYAPRDKAGADSPASENPRKKK